MKRRLLRTTSFSLFFLLSSFALINAQESPAPTEAPTRLSMFVHDFTNWLDHLGTDADHNGSGAGHSRVVSHSPPLPQPRPAKQASPVASNKELSEFAPAPVTSKKKTPTPIQIRD